MNRRDCIAYVAALAAAGLACEEREAGAAPRERPLGLELYTVGDLMAKDVAGTLAFVASVGYREVEFAGYFNTPPQVMRRHLVDAGLTAPATHVAYAEMLEHHERVIEEARAIGIEYVVVPMMPENERTLDDYRRHAEHLNRWSGVCASAGLKFGYHNHDYEFRALHGQVPYDLLLAQTGPGVRMELDLAHAVRGGADPLAYLAKWPGRFPILHLKDTDSHGSLVDIGDGVVPFGPILQAAAKGGLAHGFVERDFPPDSPRSIQRCYQAIRPLWARYVT